MEAQSDGNDDIASIKEMRQHLESRIGTRRLAQQELIASLQTVVPDIVSSLYLSLKLVSAFNGRQYTPTPIPKPKLNPNASPNPIPKTTQENNRPITPENHPLRRSSVEPKIPHPKNYAPAASTKPASAVCRSDSQKLTVDGSGSPLIKQLILLPLSAIATSIAFLKLICYCYFHNH